MVDLKRSLKEAVKKLAYSTSVDQLKKRGVKRVSVLGLDRIVSLVEEAVHRSLQHRLLSSEREAVVDATKEEFLRLLKSNEELREKQERSQEEADNLRIELQRLRQQLDERLEEARVQALSSYDGENAAILEKVRMVVGSLQAHELPPRQLQERVLELVMDVVAGERREVGGCAGGRPRPRDRSAAAADLEADAVARDHRAAVDAGLGDEGRRRGPLVDLSRGPGAARRRSASREEEGADGGDLRRQSPAAEEVLIRGPAQGGLRGPLSRRNDERRR
ncbi:MAG: hypothetical protein IPM29_01040 [Planctomycetes bacterium]|nr:hypothetical protein [Planctomycetota bacterium]